MQKAEAMLTKTEALCQMSSVKDEDLDKAVGLVESISQFCQVTKDVEEACRSSAGAANAKAVLEKLYQSKDSMAKWAKSVGQPQGNFEKVFMDLKEYADTAFTLPDGDLDRVFAEYKCATPTVVERANRQFLMRCYPAEGNKRQRQDYNHHSYGIRY